MLIGIFGTGRNGSSLLSRLLDGTPNAYVHPLEINFLSAFNDLAGPYRRLSRSTKFYSKTRSLKYLKKPVSIDRICQYYEPQVNQILDNFWKELENPFVIDKSFELKKVLKKKSYFVNEFVNEYLYEMSKWTCHKDTDTFVFKSIEVAYLNIFESLFPDMKFIHILRDPLNVYDSLVRASRISKNPIKMPSWYLAGDNLNTIIEKRWIPHSKYVLKKTQSKNHYLIKYENLIANPKSELIFLFEWLGKEMPLKFKELTTLGGYSLKNIPDNVGYVNIKTPKFVDKNILNKERLKVIFNEERNLIYYLTYSYAKKLGYFRDIVKPNITKLIIEWILPKKWEFTNSLNYYFQHYTLHKKKLKYTKKKSFSLKLTIFGIFYCIHGLIIRRTLLITKLFRE